MSTHPVDHWAVELAGDASDLAYWQKALRRPHDPWVEFQYPPDAGPRVLCSSNFDDLPTQADVRSRADAMVNLLNGALRVLAQAQSVKLTKRVGVGYIWRRQYPPESEPNVGERSSVQRWLAFAAHDKVTDDMLRHFAEGPDWGELYKAFEGVRDLAGGANGLKSKSWAPLFAEVTRFTHTANTDRHAFAHPANQKPPKNPMLLTDADAMIASMIHSMLNELAP